MKTIQVRKVSDQTHAVLKRRAAAAGMSLQEYLAEELTQLAERPTVAEVLDRAGRRAKGRIGLREAAELVRSDRDAR